MRVKNIIYIAFAALLLISPASAFDIVREDRDSWVCVDYAVDYARNNQGWGVVSISNHPHFKGASHMVNYRIVDSETILIHDEMYNAEYEIHNWQLSGEYYHFWQKEPIRFYKRLFDNREVILCEN